MRPLYLAVALVYLLTLAATPAGAQSAPVNETLPKEAQDKESYRGLTSPKAVSGVLPAAQDLGDYVVDGKLTLSLDNAIRLALENNTQIQINELQVEYAKYSLLGKYQPFDPLTTTSFYAQRAVSTVYTQLQGAASILSALSQQTQFTYAQTFQTGTNIQAFFNADRGSSNSSFNFINPYITSGLGFQFTQPLLRNRGLFPNRAPIVIARRTLRQSRANFEAQVSGAILQAVGQYWNVIQAAGNLEVVRKALAEADASYKHDKRALELGALSPLDIYRSEAAVASRKVDVIQSEYALKTQEDALRLTIGADLDPYFRALDLVLTEKPAPAGEMLYLDATTALQRAIAQRPELASLRLALANDSTSIRLAHNHLEPDLSLTGLYSSTGLGGDQLDFTTGQVIAAGGFGNSLSQLFGFGFPTYSATLTLNLPVKNRAAQAELGNALVSRRQDLYTQRQSQENITLEVSNAVHQLEQAKLSVAAANVSLDLAKKNLAAEQRKYELGSETIFFVLDAQNQLAVAEQSLLQAQVGYQLSLAGVDHATGGLLDHYHVTIADLTR
jgi:outer membrane protein